MGLLRSLYNNHLNVPATLKDILNRALTGHAMSQLQYQLSDPSDHTFIAFTLVSSPFATRTNKLSCFRRVDSALLLLPTPRTAVHYFPPTRRRLGVLGVRLWFESPEQLRRETMFSRHDVCDLTDLAHPVLLSKLVTSAADLFRLCVISARGTCARNRLP